MISEKTKAKLEKRLKEINQELLACKTQEEIDSLYNEKKEIADKLGLKMLSSPKVSLK